MKQNRNLKQAAIQRRKAPSPWIKYCAIFGVILLIFACSMYAFRYISLDREFHHNVKTFGEDTYKEIFSLRDTKAKAQSVLEQAEEAFSFVGTEEEAIERFGPLGRYCCKDPKAVSEEHTLDYIVSRIGEDTGYIWVAYTQTALDPGGEAVSAVGSAKNRILSRWTVERHGNDIWIVTEVWEAP